MENTIDALREAIQALPPYPEKTELLDHLGNIGCNSEITETIEAMHGLVGDLREKYGSRVADTCDTISEALGDINLEPDDGRDF